ncbi:hypothetical protein KVT40_005033 [Elsinoe batatas]|uniref:Helicase C-terminal domain-containing protein n=1 Tax=Elsinoe batatas TaxID=2601811 RepID=A0A8K0L4Z0_9PEZI|nr:hypothetical protein KVT40_005033 [Elsinoe batatas]
MPPLTRTVFPNTPQSLPCDSSGDEQTFHTPSSTPRKTGITALPSSSPWRHDEARCFLQDINNFIPLGCLVSDQRAAGPTTGAEWIEVYQIDDNAGLDDQKSLQDFISAGWIRVFTGAATDLEHIIYRIYILAVDAGHRFIERYDKTARSRYAAWRSLIAAVNTASSTWNRVVAGDKESFSFWAAADSESLFWMFNKIPSPNPDPNAVTDIFRRQAMIEVLDPDFKHGGLRTKLYPYQRRSAAQMLQRESESWLYLDPRLEVRTSPDGSQYYYNARDFAFHRQPMRYEAGKGGILAETMGYGKTIVTLSLIASTRGMLPKVPVEYSQTKTRAAVGSLLDMCVTATQRHAIPWKTFLNESQRATFAAQTLEQSIHTYNVPQIPIRLNRTTVTPPPKTKIMTATTLVVVPRNLCRQWQSEIEKHVVPTFLKVLVMEDLRKPLPPPNELTKYDVLLFSRNRFEQENRDGSDEQGRRFSKTPLSCACPYIGSTRERDCTCLRPDDLYNSPLKALHFLRIIIDEGHSFSSTNSIAALVAERLVTADHRWVVSGTPAKDLLGVEMDLFSVDQPEENLTEGQQRSALLNRRKSFEGKDDERAAVQNLGALISHFLQIKPWSTGQGEEGASWDEYIYRHENARKKTYKSFSKALRQTLDAVVIKTRPEDVDKDIELPPLTYETIKLEPSYYDKVTANLFTLVLTSNAVTSERTDRDYLFHKESTKFRIQLIGNLRQSAFFWTGFSRQNVLDSIGNAERYLKKEGINCTDEDKAMLLQCIESAKITLDDSGWNGLSATHELGVFVKDWPSASAETWTMDSNNPVMTGAHQVADAQDHVHSRLGQDSAEVNLTGEGIKAMVRARARGKEETDSAEGRSSTALVKSGVPLSSVNGEPSKKRSLTNKRKATSDPGSTSPSKKRRISTAPPAPSISRGPPPLLPSGSDLQQPRLIGTASAKASYLLSSILSHHETEKSLIFFSGENSAWYLAQCFDILHIPYLIYARGLSAAKKSEYIVRFNESPVERVMLMDVHQAAFGLNLSSASRVYFINPVLRPGIEAQVVKRAHRIGQIREVKVKTLVLEGTWEEAMWERARRMTREEQKVKDVEEDEGVKGVVKSMKLLELGVAVESIAKMAPLSSPQKVFCRKGWDEWGEGKWWKNRKDIVESNMSIETESPDAGGKKVKRRKHGKENRDINLAGDAQASPSQSQTPTIKVKLKTKRPKTVGFAAGGITVGPGTVAVATTVMVHATTGAAGVGSSAGNP